jgi:glycosyltransferase involved in cell wall biosynthesis
MVLLRLLRWLRANTDIPFEILLKDGNGQLRREFEDLAPVTVWNKRGKASLQQRRIGLIYSNTITNGDVLGELNPGCPVICHVHELDYWIRHRVSPDHLRQLKKRTRHYVAVSQAVKRNLVEDLGISPGDIDVIYGFIPVDEASVDEAEALRVRARLSLPPGALVVGGCGTTDWRKAPDLFIQLARAVRRRQTELGKPVHFVWVGGENQGPNFGALWHDVALAGLADCVHFVGTQTDPLPYFATFDVFALVSREDPFPLVMLEAGFLGKPIVGFDGAGGAREFVEDDAGFVVPYLDIEAMAARVLELLGSDELRHRLGAQAREKVRRHHDVAVAAPRLAALIQRFGA